MEELLRHQGPIHGAIPRLSRPAQAFGDAVIPAGELVVAMVAAGNRDPSVFADPDVLDVDQPGRRPLALGAGIHYCLGAALAKQEISHAVSAVLTEFPHLEVMEHAIDQRLVQRPGSGRPPGELERNVTWPDIKAGSRWSPAPARASVRPPHG